MIKLNFVKTMSATLLLLLAPLASAQNGLETDVLKPIIGQQEAILGARVDKVEADGELVKITLSIPAAVADGTNGKMEEVIVYGTRPAQGQSRSELPQIKRYEVVNSVEKGRSGVIIYLGKNEDFVLKFNYTDDNEKAVQGVGGH